MTPVDIWTPEAIGEAWSAAKRRNVQRPARPAGPLCGQLLAWRRTFLGRELCSDVRRCSGCGAHEPTQGHQPHCPLGYRANYALRSGRISRNA